MSNRGSIFGPLILIVIGVLLLLRHQIPAMTWEQIGRYWPVILIVWGLAKLVEYYTAPAGAVRRGLGATEVALLIVIIAGGLVFTAAMHFRDTEFGREFDWDSGDWSPFEQTHDFSTQISAPIRPAAEVIVRGFRGDISVEPATGPTISVAANDQVHAKSEAEAKNIFSSAPPSIHQENGQYVILPTSEQAQNQINANLRISLPAKSPLSVQLHSGDVHVANWNAPLNLSTDRGEVAVDSVRGDVHIQARHNSVRVEHVTGNVDVNGDGEDLTFSDISGPVTAHGEYSGTLDFSRLPKGIHFISSRTDLRVDSLPGSVTTDMEDLRLQSANNVRLDTRNKDIEIRQFSGPLEVHDAQGSVSVATEHAPAQPIHVSTRDGDLTLMLPANSQFSLNAIAHSGSVMTDFSLPVSQNGDSSEAHGSVGSKGPDIVLETTDSTISVRKTGQQTSHATGGTSL